MTRAASGFATTAALALLSSASPAAATVFEYARDGRVIVRQTFGGAPPQAPDAATSAIRTSGIRTSAACTSGVRAACLEMAKETALRHSGGAGPRRAGLDALSFRRVFVELIRAESGFDPHARSKKGAQGLGQLLPETSRLLGVQDVWDPAQNLDASARYFTTQLERFGDASLALAAYNAGPRQVVVYGGVPPFRETRAYVARIAAASGQVPVEFSAPPAGPGLNPATFPSNTSKDVSVWQY